MEREYRTPFHIFYNFLSSMRTFAEDLELTPLEDSGEDIDEIESLSIMRQVRGYIVLQYERSEFPIFDFCDEIISRTENKLMRLDDKARSALLTREVRFLPLILITEMIGNDTIHKVEEKLKKKYPHEPGDDYVDIFDLIVEYASTIKTFTVDYDLIDSIRVSDEQMDHLLSLPEPKLIPFDDGSPRRRDKEKRQGHKIYPATYRRAAVMALIDKSGLCKNIDRTKKAAFVEAVTGGNISVEPQNTLSYKAPERNAIKAAAELLKTIGIE